MTQPLLNEPSNANYDVVYRYLEGRGMTFTSHPEDHLCVAGISLQHVQVRLLAYAPPDQPLVIILLVLPLAVPPESRPAVGEFLHRVNLNLRCGGFEIDFDDGEVRFSVATFLDEVTAVTDAMLERWLNAAATTVDGFFSVLMRVAFGQMLPTQAVEQGEAHLAALLERL